MNKTKTFILVIVYIMFLEACAISGNLKNVSCRNFPTINYSSSNVIFLETRAASGNGVTLAEILEAEKSKFGSDITLCNIIEQNKEIKFLFIKVGVEKSYLYDVVRLKKN
jgi:hypothetical protein